MKPYQNLALGFGFLDNGLNPHLLDIFEMKIIEFVLETLIIKFSLPFCFQRHVEHFVVPHSLWDIPSQSQSPILWSKTPRIAKVES